jgi:hypothetical protein
MNCKKIKRAKFRSHGRLLVQKHEWVRVQAQRWRALRANFEPEDKCESSLRDIPTNGAVKFEF